MKDVVEILRIELLKRQKINPLFSMRSFAKWLNLSPAQLSQIMSGKRPLTIKTFKKISQKLILSPLEIENISKNILSSSQENQDVINKLKLNDDKFKIISDWYHLSILSLTQIINAKPDPLWIANSLNIKVIEAKAALERLVKLGLVSIKKEFKQLISPFEVITETPSKAIKIYHKQNLQLAIDKIEEVDMKYRDFQSLVLAIDDADILKYKKLITEFLNDIEKLQTNKKKNSVFHLNVNFFPVTNIEKYKQQGVLNDQK